MRNKLNGAIVTHHAAAAGTISLFFPYRDMTPNSEPDSESLADQAIDWLVLLRSGNVSLATRQAFDAWHANPAHRAAFAEAEALWGLAATAIRHDQMAGNAAPRRAVNRFLAAAASILLTVALAWNPVADWAASDYRTGFGEQRQLSLADGSQVLLNTDSAIAVDLTAQQRRIRLLHGQAEFRVAKDTARPFVVDAGGTAVRALGTVFEVYADGADRVDVSVSEHAVAVDVAHQPATATVRIEEGQHWRHERGEALAQPIRADMTALNARKRGKFIFQDRPLAEVVAELNRYSAAKIVIKGTELEQRRLSGVFPLETNQVLEAVEDLLAIRSTRLSPWLVVLHA